MLFNLLNFEDKSKRIIFLISLMTSLAALIGSLFAAYQFLFPKDNLPSIVEFPPFTSGWVGGGHNADQICNGKLNEYLRENPKYSIEIRRSEENRRKMFPGRVQYNYTCRFIGTKKQ
ncbi:hypothetical protein [Methylobacterium sp. XJLW]|uniref:hypothetical protein n=1 Tax=Methylobacterium sp. XJLW TaxID=739141 RepID=UPI000F555C33|nr:hypothetical protein [Methylobacterium sp. XJLW]